MKILESIKAFFFRIKTKQSSFKMDIWLENEDHIYLEESANIANQDKPKVIATMLCKAKFEKDGYYLSMGDG